MMFALLQIPQPTRLVERFLLADVLDPRTTLGALFYAIVLFAFASGAAWSINRAVKRLLNRYDVRKIDTTGLIFLGKLAQTGMFVIALVVYAHLIPELHHLATALLTGASIISVVLGLAAQNTLGNLISGISLLMYRPFAVGDQLQIAALGQIETGRVEQIGLGHTTLRTADDRRIVVPNSLIASQVTANLGSSAA